MAETLVALGSIAAATLFGSMLFFSAVVAPLVFVNLEPATAGRFIRSLFPWYYLFVLVVAATAAAALALGRPADAGVMALIALGALVSRQLLMPRINAHRDMAQGGIAGSARRFDRLHRVSVWINTVQLVAAFAVLVRIVLA